MRNESQKTKEFVKSLIDYNNLSCVECRMDGSLILTYSIVTKLGALTEEMQLDKDSEVHRYFTELVGTINPGQFKYFKTHESDEHLDFDDELLIYGIENGKYRMVKITEDSIMKVQMWNKHSKDYTFLTFPAESSQIKAVMKLTGPLKPGEEHYFENYKEPDQV